MSHIVMCARWIRKAWGSMQACCSRCHSQVVNGSISQWICFSSWQIGRGHGHFSLCRQADKDGTPPITHNWDTYSARIYQAFRDWIIRLHGMPVSLIRHRPHFNKELWKSSLAGIRLGLTSKFYLHLDKQTERINCTLEGNAEGIC